MLATIHTCRRPAGKISADVSRIAAVLTSRRSRAVRFFCGTFLACLSLLCASQAQYSARPNSLRQSQNDNEPYLNPTNVNVAYFGNLYSYPVDGYVVAQPLYMPDVTIPNVGTVNVVYVATQNDSVYAFNADASGAPLWQTSFLGSGVTPVPMSAQGCSVVTGYNQVGIVGTPVIDPTTNTLYVVAKTQEGTSSPYNYVFRLHALDITTGLEKTELGSPVVITASVMDGQTQVTLDNEVDLQRVALVEVNGTILIGFGSNGCDRSAHGWLLAYNAANVQQQEAVFNTSPADQWGSSLWMSGVGPAIDSDNNIYLVTANGTFDVNTGGSDWGDTVMKLTLGASSFSVADYFTPFNQATMGSEDLDLGSGGAVLLPSPSSGPYPNLMVVTGKTGTIYLINCNDMGEYDTGSGGTDAVVQELPGAVGGVWGAPVYWNNAIYFAGRNDYVKAFPFVNGQLTTPPVESNFAYTLTGIPSLSANGDTNGVIWLVVNGSDNTNLLAAFNASTLQTNLGEIYNTSQDSTRDSLGTAPHFATPMIANGRVYVGTTTQVKVYGLFPELQIASGNNQTQTVNQSITLTVQAVNPYTSVGIANVPVKFSDGKGGSFNPVTATTNSSGIATTVFTLPKVAGDIGVTATSSGYSTASFSETAVAGPPATIGAYSGNAQTGTVGTALPSPLVSVVKDQYGNFVSNVAVTFNDGGLGGTFQPNPATTGSNGQASASYTLPTVAKTGFPITASYGSGTSATYHETSTAGAPSSMVTSGGNKQSGAPGTQLPKALIVTVKDQYGNVVPNVTVSFTDNGAGGSFSAPTATTNSQGEASTLYTLPSSAGTFTITATSGSASVNFSEMAN
jgi:hypothetical protein